MDKKGEVWESRPGRSRLGEIGCGLRDAFSLLVRFRAPTLPVSLLLGLGFLVSSEKAMLPEHARDNWRSEKERILAR